VRDVVECVDREDAKKQAVRRDAWHETEHADRDVHNAEREGDPLEGTGSSFADD
jgi:hypothetical protein